ncbi:helix-turn-helix transcriptional regulator [Maribellus sp. YY47]|uniref:helix-turn-helix domain-containing protein n=1 Tax=Maribellus sp. YY47 TaxID=2929486 RepID=UPI002000672B|nr:helix-turn-helix transcriptional regulator [Maribellus sp. YY47]MCK3686058.1 helix-turn-helix domain-containing protein [Maribellus sp. YY47]
MKDRIKEYMDYKSINAGELALMLDVQRSNISHILNGRNKPGAAFIEKMLTVFPDLDARWLLTGAGEMIENSAKDAKPAAEEEKPHEVKKEPVEEPMIQEQITKVKSDPVVKSVFSSDAIEKVILIYKDGTFTTHKNR